MDLISQIALSCDTLSDILDQEYQALESKELEHVESIQAKKLAYMQSLQETWDAAREAIGPDESQLLDELMSKLNSCKDKHLRNSLILNKQVEITRNLLDAITQKSTENASVYDRLGKLV